MRSVDKMTKEQLETELAKVIPRVAELRDEHEKINKALMEKFNRQKAIEKQLIKIDYEANKAEGITDWAALLEFTYLETTYEFLKEELHNKCPLGSISQSGYFPNAMQWALQLRLRKNDQAQIDEAVALIEEVYKVMRPADEDKKFVIFDILESTCSAYASYKMAYDIETKEWFAGQFSRYARTPNQYSGGPFKTAREAVEYVSENCWIESDDPADNERGDY